MKIAVTYDNGEVFQHFGRTEQFKVYDVQDDKVVASEVIGSDGLGHGALAGLLDKNSIDVLICGGIGGGAVNALSEAGIEVCAGSAGNTDQVVEAYLKGELESTGVNCDHHGEEHSCGEHGCGNHEDGEQCGGGCGGCGGGCHSLLFEGPNAGKVMRVHYKGTFNDGTQFDASYDRGEPLEFVCAAGMMIPGFDKAVVDMKVGEIKEIHLMPEEAYGPSDPSLVFSVPVSEMPGAEDLKAGQQVYLANEFGQQFPVSVVECDGERVTFDANHEMAGKELNFTIEVVEIVD